MKAGEAFLARGKGIALRPGNAIQRELLLVHPTKAVYHHEANYHLLRNTLFLYTCHWLRQA
jgi:hypothetical protein